MYKLYIDKGTFIHKLHPVVKIIWLVDVVIIAWMFNKWEYSLAIFIWALLYAILAKASFRKIFVGTTSLLILWTTIVAILVWPAWVRGGRVLFEWSIFRFTDDGLSVAISTGLRFGACLVACIGWLMTTSQSELIEGVLDIGVPYQFSFGMMLALRYAPVLLGEVGRVREAQKSRAFDWNRGSILRRIRAFAENTRVLVVPLFSRMLRSIDEIALCLDSKGCDFSTPRKRRKLSLKASDKAFLALIFCITLIVIILRWMGYGWISMM